MITLPTEYTKSGFKYTQVKREGLVAIYKMQPIEESNLVWYEVFEIIPQPDRVVGPNKYFSAAHEVVPSDEKWGVMGFSVHFPEQAEKYFNILKARVDARIEKKDVNLAHATELSTGVQKSNNSDKKKSKAKGN